MNDKTNADITLEGAKSIAQAAAAAGLATPPASESEGWMFSPVLKAKLAELGVESILQLNDEQTDAVEAFIAERASQ